MEHVTEEELIDCIRQHGVIYDHNSAEFKDKEKKSRAWEEVAQKCRSRVSDCQRRYCSIRSTLSRYLKSIRPHGNSEIDDDVTLDKKYGHLQWLVPYIKHRPISINKQYYGTSAMSYAKLSAEEENSEEATGSSHASICDDTFEIWQVSNDRPGSMIDNSKKKDCSSSGSERVRPLKRIANDSDTVEDDCGHFCSFLAAKMRKLTPYNQLLAQQKILAAMMDVEFKQEPQPDRTVLNTDAPTSSQMASE